MEKDFKSPMEEAYQERIADLEFTIVELMKENALLNKRIKGVENEKIK